MQCCVVGCNNRPSPNSKVKFHRIPRRNRSFQDRRRQLWLKAIQQVNGSTDDVKGNALVCGAHFISGAASMDHDDPDFVPSIFPCSNQSPSLKKKEKWVFGHRKKRHKANVKVMRTTPPEDDSPLENQSTVFMDETQTSQSPSVPKEGETLITGSETEPETNTVESLTSSSPNQPSPSFKVPADTSTNTVESPTSSSPNKPSPSFKVPADTSTNTVESPTSSSPNKPSPSFKVPADTSTNTVKSPTSSSPNKPSPSFKVPADRPKQEKKIPTVHLKSVFAPAGGFQCDLCNEVFTAASQLVTHKQLHEEEGRLICDEADFTQLEEELSFPCNMCDRSFTTSHNLKRHKLLHVKDGRRCRKCGVIFCRLHNHVVFKPQPESERDSLIAESLVEHEPTHPTDSNDIATSPLQTATVRAAFPAPPTPKRSSRNLNPLPPVSHTRIISDIPLPVFIKPSSVPHPPLPVYSRDDFPGTVAQTHLPPALQIFSPQNLTSAFLEVKRNYEYILSKPTGDKIEKVVVKEEPCEPDNEFEKDIIAYDLEIVL